MRRFMIALLICAAFALMLALTPTTAQDAAVNANSDSADVLDDAGPQRSPKPESPGPGIEVVENPHWDGEDEDEPAWLYILDLTHLASRLEAIDYEYRTPLLHIVSLDGYHKEGSLYEAELRSRKRFAFGVNVGLEDAIKECAEIDHGTYFEGLDLGVGAEFSERFALSDSRIARAAAEAADYILSVIEARIMVEVSVLESKMLPSGRLRLGRQQAQSLLADAALLSQQTIAVPIGGLNSAGSLNRADALLGVTEIRDSMGERTERQRVQLFHGWECIVAAALLQEQRVAMDVRFLRRELIPDVMHEVFDQQLDAGGGDERALQAAAVLAEGEAMLYHFSHFGEDVALCVRLTDAPDLEPQKVVDLCPAAPGDEEELAEGIVRTSTLAHGTSLPDHEVIPKAELLSGEPSRRLGDLPPMVNPSFEDPAIINSYGRRSDAGWHWYSNYAPFLWWYSQDAAYLNRPRYSDSIRYGDDLTPVKRQLRELERLLSSVTDTYAIRARVETISRLETGGHEAVETILDVQSTTFLEHPIQFFRQASLTALTDIHEYASETGLKRSPSFENAVDLDRVCGELGKSGTVQLSYEAKRTTQRSETRSLSLMPRREEERHTIEIVKLARQEDVVELRGQLDEQGNYSGSTIGTLADGTWVKFSVEIERLEDG